MKSVSNYSVSTALQHVSGKLRAVVVTPLERTLQDCHVPATKRSVAAGGA